MSPPTENVCNYTYSNIPRNRAVRNFILSHPNRKLDRIFAQTTNYPPGAFPPEIVLPSWLRWPLNQKLPQLTIHNGDYWSRGPLGKSLLFHPKQFDDDYDLTSRPDFILVDPTHATVTYDPLHDPGLKKHFENPNVKCLLKKNGFLDEKGFVKCSQKEQNEYRAYLHSLIGRDECETYINMEMDTHIQRYKENKAAQLMERDWTEKFERWEDTVQRGKDVKAAKRAQLEKNYAINQQHFQRRSIIVRKGHKEKDNLKPPASKTSEDFSMAPIFKSSNPRTSALLRTEWAEDAKYAKIQKKRAQEDEKKKARWDAMVASMQKNSEMKKCAREIILQDRQRRIAAREEHILDHRRIIPMRIKQKKRAEQRKKEISKKYGMIWLDKTRERLKNVALDVEHATSFEIYESLDITVGYLYNVTGQKEAANVKLALAQFNFKGLTKKNKNILC